MIVVSICDSHANLAVKHVLYSNSVILTSNQSTNFSESSSALSNYSKY